MRRKLRHVLIVLSSGIFLSGCVVQQTHVHEKMAAHDNVELGLAYLNQGNAVLAKEKLLLAEQEAPSEPVVLDALAYFSEKTGDTKRARKYYFRALKLAPNNGAVLNNIGVFLCQQQESQEGEKLLLKAAELPNYINTAESYENAGLCALNMNDKQKAKIYFKKALEEDPQRITSLNELKVLHGN